MPCHVLGCECARFDAVSQAFMCPVCSREYATRASLEIHLYGQHPGLSSRERSMLLQGAMSGRTVLPPSIVARLPTRPDAPDGTAAA